MSRSALAVAALAVAAVTGWHLSAQDAKSVDLAPLREAVEKAIKRGENVDEVRKALGAFEKVGAKPGAAAVPPELQALRDAVDAAARKGENVEAIAKELAAVETAVAGRSLEKPKPKPDPLPEDPRPNPRPGFPGVRPVPFPDFQPGIGGGGIDRELFDKAMALRREAMELMVQGNRDPETRAKAQKMLQEASDMLQKAIRGGVAVPNPVPFPPFPEIGRVPANDRGRLGIRMDRVPAVAADQLGLDPNVGIAVSLVVPGSPAEKAGLKVNDIILELAGKPVSDSTEEFVRRVTDVKPNEKVDLVVLRKGKKVDVKGIELPAAARPEFPRPVPVPFPELPQLKPQPLPIPNLNPIVVPDGFDSVSFSTTNGEFTLKAKKGDTGYAITGAFDAAGAATPRTVTVTEGNTSAELPADKLPAERRREVEALLKSVQRANP
jgi:serine protease Do